MVCSQCEAAVPEESAFCLRCGARLVRLERPAPINGRGAPTTGAATVETPKADAGLSGKQPWALSFRSLADERLRYRVARWVCEVAPAHGLTEVQADLSRGEFATVLALTAEEAEVTRERIERLGAPPTLWRLAPASTAELLLPARPRQEEQRANWSPQKKFAAVGVALALLFLFGLVSFNLYRMSVPEPGTLPAAPPSIGGRP